MAMQIIAWRARSPSGPRAANSGATLGGRWGLTAQRARAEGGYAAVDNFRSFCSLHILTKRAKTAIDDRPGVVAQIL